MTVSQNGKSLSIGFSGIQLEQIDAQEKSDRTASLVSAEKISASDMYVGDMGNFKAGEVFLDRLSVNNGNLSFNIDAVRFTDASAQRSEKIDISMARFDGASIAITDNAGNDILPLVFA